MKDAQCFVVGNIYGEAIHERLARGAKETRVARRARAEMPCKDGVERQAPTGTRGRCTVVHA